MRRNRDLIRQLLMEIEDCDTGDGESVELDFGEADTLVARGHLNLFVEEVSGDTTNCPPDAMRN